jgi:hypothetical protein
MPRPADSPHQRNTSWVSSAELPSGGIARHEERFLLGLTGHPKLSKDAMLPHDRRGIGEYQSAASVMRFAWGISLSIDGVELAMIASFCREHFVF